jgi:hypothetical protein
MPENESPAEFRERVRSIGVIRGGRTKPLEKIIVREDKGDGNVTDIGRKARVTINEDRDVVLTTSDNRQDVNIFGTAAVMNGEGGVAG